MTDNQLEKNEILRVTVEGEFIWKENADEMIETGDFSASPATQHILKSLREVQRLREVNAELVESIANLIKVKGRHNTEIAYQRLVAAYDKAQGDNND